MFSLIEITELKEISIISVNDETKKGEFQKGVHSACMMI